MAWEVLNDMLIYQLCPWATHPLPLLYAVQQDHICNDKLDNKTTTTMTHLEPVERVQGNEKSFQKEEIARWGYVPVRRCPDFGRPILLPEALPAPIPCVGT